MAKKRISDIAKESGKTVENIGIMCDMMLTPEMVTGKKNARWVNEDGQKILNRELELKEASMTLVKMKVLHEAQNKNFVFAHDKEAGIKVPVLINKRLSGKCVGKMIPVEIITDSMGQKSYRCPSVRFF